MGVEAVEPQVAEDEGLDRTRSHALLTLPWESLPDSPIPRPISYGGYRSKYGSDSMPNSLKDPHLTCSLLTSTRTSTPLSRSHASSNKLLPSSILVINIRRGIS